MFEEPKGANRVSNYDFRFINFWVRFHDLPMVCLCRKWAEVLGNSIGTFVEVDLDKEDKSWENSLRIKVKIDVKELLERGLVIKVGTRAKESWVSVTYERLPDFCYKCGKLGHTYMDCDEEIPKEEEGLYGDWMRSIQKIGGANVHKSHEFKPPQARGRGRGRGQYPGGRYTAVRNQQHERKGVQAEEEAKRREPRAQDRPDSSERHADGKGGKEGPHQQKLNLRGADIPTDSSEPTQESEQAKKEKEPCCQESQEISSMDEDKTEKADTEKDISFGNELKEKTQAVDESERNKLSGPSNQIKNKEIGPEKEVKKAMEKVMKGINKPKGNNDESGPEKEIKRAMELDRCVTIRPKWMTDIKMEKAVSINQCDTSAWKLNQAVRINQCDFSTSNESGKGKSIRKWKRLARQDKGDEKTGIPEMNKTRKHKGDELEMPTNPKKLCTTYFESNEGISAEAAGQPHRMP